jgi:hypothetical protein
MHYESAQEEEVLLVVTAKYEEQKMKAMPELDPYAFSQHSPHPLCARRIKLQYAAVQTQGNIKTLA